MSAFAWCLWGAMSVAVAADEPEPHPLDDPSFAFCHRAGVDAELAKPWCDRLDEIPKDRCPGLHETCAGAVAPPTTGCQPTPTGGEGNGRDLAAEPERPREEWELPSGLPDLAGVGEVLRWVMALLVAGLVLWLLRIMIARFGRPASPQAPRVVVDVVVDEAALDEALPEVPSAPSDDLLQLARRALDEGRAGDAVVLARGAALRRLGERGALRLHRSRTDREYVRALEGEPRDALRLVVAMVEVFRFGRQAPPTNAAREALAAAERILRMSAVLFALFVADSAWASRHDPEGDASLRELFAQRGYDVRWRLRPLDQLVDEERAGDAADALLIDTSAVGVDDWDAIRGWVERGHVLVIVGSPIEAFPELGRVVSVDVDSVALSTDAQRAGLGVPRLPGDDLMAFSWHSGEGFVTSPDGDPVIAVNLGSGVLVAIADPRLVMNAAFAVPSNADLVGELLLAGQALRGWPLATPITLQLATRVVATSESQPNNPFESIARAELLPFVLHFLWLWMVVAMWRGTAFAARRDPPEAGRIRFADHVEALGARYRQLKAGSHVYRAYADLQLQRLGSSGLIHAAMAAGQSRAQAEATVAEIERRVADPSDPGDGDDLARLDELWRLVQQRADQGKGE